MKAIFQSPLSIQVPLHQREPLMSFLSRIAVANGVENLSTFCLDMRLKLGDAINGRTEVIKAVAELAAVSTESLIKWSFLKLPDRTASLDGHIIPWLAFRPARLRICPRCVSEQLDEAGLKGVHIPAENLLPGYRTCEKHEFALLPLPYQGHSQFLYDHCRRIADHEEFILQTCRLTDRQRPISSLERYIIDRFIGRPTDCWLDGLELNAVSKMSEMLGAVLRHGSHVGSTILSQKDWYEAGQVGFDAIKASRSAMSEIFENIKRRERSGMHCSLKYLGMFYQWLAFGAKQEQFKPVKAILREYAAKNHAFGTNDVILGERCPERHLHTVASACQDTGLHRATMIRILGLAGHIDRKQRRQNYSTLVFPTQQIQSLIDQLNTTMPQTSAQKFLNISRPQFNALKDMGIFQGIKLYPGARAAYKKTDLEYFFQRLSQNAVVVSTPSIDMEPISLAANMVLCPASDVVNMLIRQELKVVEKIKGEYGVGSLRVSVSELRHLLWLPKKDWFFRGELANYLGINDWGLKALFDLGYLPRTRQRNPSTRKIADAVSRRDVASFVAKYVSLKNYAAEQKVSVQKLSHRLKKGGITPISLPTGVRSQIFVREILPNDSIPIEPSDVSGHHR